MKATTFEKCRGKRVIGEFARLPVLWRGTKNKNGPFGMACQ